jgi:ABC-type nitrate/sulfonate/bicarbonate transport system permease component
MNHASAVAKLWLTRLLWLVVAALAVVLVVHIPSGIVRDSSAPPPQPVVRAPRTDPLQPFRIMPEETKGAAGGKASWSWAQYGQSLRAYEAVLTTGEIAMPARSAREPARRLQVVADVKVAWGRSLLLFAIALLGGGLLGLLLGALALGTRLVRSSAVGISVAGLALPDFFLVLLGQMATIWTYKTFGFRLWSVLGNGGEFGFSWLLPILALGMAPMAFTARLTMTALDEIMREDFIRTARAKGIPEVKVILGHAMRNALPRILNGLPAIVNATLSSQVVVELLTNMTGLGDLLMKGWPYAPTVGLVFCVWFAVLDGLANTAAILASPRLGEVAA